MRNPDFLKFFAGKRVPCSENTLQYSSSDGCQKQRTPAQPEWQRGGARLDAAVTHNRRSRVPDHRHVLWLESAACGSQQGPHANRSDVAGCRCAGERMHPEEQDARASCAQKGHSEVAALLQQAEASSPAPAPTTPPVLVPDELLRGYRQNDPPRSATEGCDCGYPHDRVVDGIYVCRYFGHFECDCCGRWWTSPWCWKNLAVPQQGIGTREPRLHLGHESLVAPDCLTQKCQGCETSTWPWRTDPDWPYETDPDKPHDSIRCGMCQLLGKNCMKLRERR